MDYLKMDNLESGDIYNSRDIIIIEALIYYMDKLISLLHNIFNRFFY